MVQKFWENKRVLITGSGGFIGQHLSYRLHSEKAQILGLTRSPKFPYEKAINLQNKHKVNEVFEEFSPDICFHLASTSVVEIGQKSPFSTFQNNILSTLNILENSRIYKLKRTIIASTVHVYGESPLPYREDEQARPSRPYETSKTCSDLIAQSYADSFNVPVIIPRFVNIYGPGDVNFTRIIPRTIQSVLHNENPTMWGGSSEREYLYIDDAIDAYMLLAQMTDGQIERNRIYNFGTGKPISVSDVMQTVIRLSGMPVSIKLVKPEREDEIVKQSVTSEKAKKVLKWKPKISFDAGIRSTIDWYRNYFRMNRNQHV